MASIQTKTTKRHGRTYYVVVSHHGRHKWLRAGTLSEARQLKRQIETMAQSERIQRLGLAVKNKRIDDFFQEYVNNVKLRTAPRTHKRYQAVLNTFITFMRLYHPGLRLVHQITPDILEDYQQRRLTSTELKTAADGQRPGTHRQPHLPLPQTVNYELSVLRSAFIWAHEHKLIESVPTRLVRKLRPGQKRQIRLLSAKECRHLLKTARELARESVRFKGYAQALTFLLNTGLRSGELCHLTWDDVDLSTGLIKIQPKDGWAPKSYARQFFLNDTALQILKRLPKTSPWVFVDHREQPLTIDKLRHALVEVAQKAGLPDLTRVHDLRHTFNSLMQMQGVDAGTMMKILGHRDLKTTMIYTHQTDDHLKQAVNRLKIK